jgi:hypothetical protein
VGAGAGAGAAIVTAASAAPGGGDQALGDTRPDFKYQEVVRKRAARQALPAYECAACKQWYAALETWGMGGGPLQPPPSCGHTPSVGPAGGRGGGGVGVGQLQQQQGAGGLSATAAAAGGGGGAGVYGQVGAGLQEVGRHRARWAPPSTPEGYWDMGFRDSLDSRCL